MSELTTQLQESLIRCGQDHLLRFFDELPPNRQQSLIDQIASLNIPRLKALADEYVLNRPNAALPERLEPAPFYPHNLPDHAQYRSRGEQVIRDGKVAAFTVAGGQGTRLGWNGPKGTFPATCVTGKPLFRVFAEQIVANQRKYGITIPWYIMTSPGNDAETRAFITDNNCFGIERRNIFMFPQGVMPSFDIHSGRILLEEKDTIAFNPDGHGGSLMALRASGALEDMAVRGIEHISYFQVDNPLVKVIDPLFIGLHIGAPDSSAEMSSKMVPKAYPGEKMGVFCRADGKTTVIEYSDLPAELAEAVREDGTLRFIAGSIAVHLLSVEFVERLTEEEQLRLPWHRAEKIVPHIDLESGERIEPTTANAVKLETFVFDALPQAKSSIVLETSRVEEFAPIKNATGVDSAASSAQIQSDRSAAWLSTHGVEVPRDADGHAAAMIEISPLTALEPDDLVKASLPTRIAPGQEVVL